MINLCRYIVMSLETFAIGGSLHSKYGGDQLEEDTNPKRRIIIDFSNFK